MADYGNDDLDKQLQCIDCGVTFLFSRSEQAHFARKGFKDPIRCPEHRARRRAERQAGERRPLFTHYGD